MTKFALLCTVVLVCALRIEANKLESFNVDPDGVTVSGLSSGGAQAMQLHVAFSDVYKGAAIFAGIPYGCADGGLISANTCMYSPGLTDINKLANMINNYESSGKVAPTTNLEGSKVFVFHGTKDTTVFPASGEKVVELYERYGAQVETEFTIGAVHGFPTDFYGAACGSSSAMTQYINNCDYHGAYIALNYMYGGNLIAPSRGSSVVLNGVFQEFDQSEFGAGPLISSMDTKGYMYIPSGCMDKTNKCKLHVALHGCAQSKSTIQDKFGRNTGYMEVGELNNIIILFPQATSNMMMGNPNACWDWWGYADKDFLNKDGVQMEVLRKIVSRAAFCDGNEDCFENEPTTEAPTTTTTAPTTTPSDGSTTMTTTTTTSPPGEINCQPNIVTFHPFPGTGNCDYYVMCACGTEVLLQCAPGLYFDPSRNTCNFQQLVPCEDTLSHAHPTYYEFARIAY